MPADAIGHEIFRGNILEANICYPQMTDRELKKGSAELLVLALLEECPRHGYQIAQLIEERSGGDLSFHVTSLYPILYHLENRKLVKSRWVEKPGQRRRRYYRITPTGSRRLAQHRRRWEDFLQALTRVAGLRLGEV